MNRRTLLRAGAAGTLRFFLYRSIREFAAARLDAAGLRGASRRHAQWYATRARVFANAVHETGTAAALATLALERDNLWAIPGRLANTGDIALVGHALLALDPLAHADGSLAVLLAGLTQVLAAAGLPDAQLIPTLARKADEVDSMTVAMANLFVYGHDLDFRTLFAPASTVSAQRSSGSREWMFVLPQARASICISSVRVCRKL
mgnify:CR=1 FL=1